MELSLISLVSSLVIDIDWSARNLSLLAVVFLAIHVVTAILDPFVTIGWAAAVVPVASPYRPLWIGLGAVALDLMAALVLTSLARARIGRASCRERV